jgi:sulfate transport system permease protein
MGAALPLHAPVATSARRPHQATEGPAWVRWLLIGAALSFLALFLLMPLVAVFAEAFRKGYLTYLASFNDADALSAIKLTLLTAAIAVPLNLVFGIAAAWCITKFAFAERAC